MSKPSESTKLLYEHLKAAELGFVVRREAHRVDVMVPEGRDFRAVRLEGDNMEAAIIHRSTKPTYRKWQVSFFVNHQVVGDESWDTLQQALDSARARGLIIDKAS